MPLEVVKLSRSLRSKICKEEFYLSPDIGFCASQNMRYYGYKIHAVCSVDGIFICFDLTQASVCDIYILKEVIHDWDDNKTLKILENCVAAMNKKGKILIIEHVHFIPKNKLIIGRII